MRVFIVLFFAVAAMSRAPAGTFFTGIHKSLNDVQDKKGKEATNPISPGVAIGWNFQLPDNFGFSPSLGYIHNTVNSDDSYGKYKMYTIYLLYDFMWIPMSFSERLALRFGLGTFRKTIKGEGGSVTVPNLNTTTTAYRPGKSSTSYSSTFNFGADYTFDFLQDWFNNFGVRLEFFTFRPLSMKYRTFAYTFGAVAYF